MTPERWQRLQAIVEKATQYPAEEREACLATTCEDDAQLLEQARSLLRYVDADDERLDAIVRKAVISTADGKDPMLERRIGAYVVRRELGRGGMGAVYLAERADQSYEQAVAIKVLGGAVGEAAQRRLRYERQILAGLEHPNIARLLDGGTTEAGQPYLVMEYVDGERLDRYCDRRRLGIDARLALLARVMDAVQYAHRHLVVHCDLKPGNILVNAEGEPKLLDFGIATIMGESEASALETLTLLHAMTPEYASPEQIRGETLSTASDIYSLGVLMYELLTGHRTLQFDSLRPARLEVVAVNQVPTEPSHVVRLNRRYLRPGNTTEIVEPEAVAVARASTPGELARELRGDLDAICQQALRKEPEQRYESAQAMRQDLQAYRANQPVSARSMSWRYRSGKFISRHRFAVATAALALVLLGGFAMAMTLMSVRLAEQRDRALAAESQARQEQTTAERVAGFLVSVFEQPDPDVARGESLSAKQLLDRGAERVQAELDDEPAVRAQLRDVMARVYRALGAFSEAEALARKAVATRERLHGERSAPVAESLTTLAETIRASGQLTEALPIYRKLHALQRELSSNPSEALALIENNLGLLLTQLGEYETAQSLLESSLEQRTQLLGLQHWETAISLHNLGLLHRKIGDIERAEQILRKALDIRIKTQGEDHPGVYRTLVVLAGTLQQQARYADAEQMFRRIVDYHRRIYQGDHPQVADSLSNLATVLHDQNLLAQAEPIYREALAMEARLHGGPRLSTAYKINNYATLLDDLNHTEEAEKHYRRSLALRRQLLGVDHAAVAHAMDNLGKFLTRQGKLGEAKDLVDHALAWRLEKFGEVHPQVAKTQINRAILANALGQYGEAESLARKGLAAYAATLGENHWRHAWGRSVLGGALTGQARFGAAADHLQVGYERIVEVKGPAAPDARRARARWLEWFERQNRDVPPALAGAEAPNAPGRH
ncbi:MAG: serine/threonine-protein kinase [Wenzhouxiangellaceae bacterium]